MCVGLEVKPNLPPLGFNQCKDGANETENSTHKKKNNKGFRALLQMKNSMKETLVLTSGPRGNSFL
jgi:hypothetical protein